MASLKCLNTVKTVHQIAYGNVYSKNPTSDVLIQLNKELANIDGRILKAETEAPTNTTIKEINHV